MYNKPELDSPPEEEHCNIFNEHPIDSALTYNSSQHENPLNDLLHKKLR
jgi:hypothetical protein